VGADSALDFSAWKNPEAVIEMSNIIVAPRPGSDLAKMEPRLRGRTQILQSPTLELSSTLIRTRIHEGQPIRFLVPDAVEQYIRNHRLYTA
jgi:nicotinate-nucleotide adenylyltransferase